MPTAVPASVQTLFWSDPDVPHTVENDAPEIVHRIFAYGDLDDIRWLKRTYDIETLRRLFIENPRTVYTASAFHFATEIVLHIEASSLDRSRYIKCVASGEASLQERDER